VVATAVAVAVAMEIQILEPRAGGDLPRSVAEACCVNMQHAQLFLLHFLYLLYRCWITRAGTRSYRHFNVLQPRGQAPNRFFIGTA
jgi:hypothetical protein